MPVELILRDPAHLDAHRAEFAVDLERILEMARQGLETRKLPPGTWTSFELRCPIVVGKSGLKRVWPWTRGSFWSLRSGRSIPSHLIRGRRRKTRSLCVWGFWRDESSFVLHTVYPGKPAPREIHDPELRPEEIPASLRFWSRHAIIFE